MSEADAIRERRREMKRCYGSVYGRLSSILFVADPVGINFETNTDEYEPEVGTILPRLQGCGCVVDVRRVVHEEFVRWFDADIAGGSERYQAVAEQIWTELVPMLKTGDR